jgi:hypothetical protein
MTTYSVATGGATATDATTVAGPVSGGAVTPDSATGIGVNATTVGPGAKASSVDTVTLQGKVRNAVKVSHKAGNVTAGGRIGSVVFVYNSKGQLYIRFMDSKNSLIYQTPPVLMASTASLMMSPSSSVSARL